MDNVVNPTIKFPSTVAPVRAASWLDAIGYFDDERATQFYRALTYGDAGSGKTHFLGTWPKPFVLDYDAGGKTLRDKHIPFLPLYESAGVVRKTLDVLDAALAKRAPFDSDAIETIGIDSLSALSSAAITDFMLQANRNPMEQKASFDEWGKLGEFFKELGKRIRRLSQMYNVVATALVMVEKDENTGICFGKPMLEGKTRDKIAALFDEVYFCVDETQKDTRKYALYTARFQFYNAKTRLGLPYRIEDPSYAKLVSAAK